MSYKCWIMSTILSRP